MVQRVCLARIVVLQSTGKFKSLKHNLGANKEYQ